MPPYQGIADTLNGCLNTFAVMRGPSGVKQEQSGVTVQDGRICLINIWIPQLHAVCLNTCNNFRQFSSISPEPITHAMRPSSILIIVLHDIGTYVIRKHGMGGPKQNSLCHSC